jgi:hypothetical protein
VTISAAKTAALLVVLAGAWGACHGSDSAVPPQTEDREENIYRVLSRGTIAAADDLLENRWNLGKSFPVVTLPFPLNWTEDPLRDQQWRFLFYSLRPTSNLLYAYYATGERKYRDKLLDILTGFAIYDDSRPVGPPYDDRTGFDHRHAAAFRAMVLVNTLVKLERSGDISPDLAGWLGASIGRLGKFLATPMNFEPDYNHGFTEAAALALVAATFPSLSDAPSWQATAMNRLSSLMANSVDGNGVEMENSPFYHFYVLGLAYQIERWGRRYGIPLPSSFTASLHSMVPYATLVLQPDGSIPLAGASVELGVENLDPAVFGDLATEFPEFAYVYTSGASGTAPSGRAVLFPESGQAFLRSGFGTSASDVTRETHVAFNVGKWRTSHSHLDVLAVDYYAAGGRQLCDSGLYSYDPGPDYTYFFGTRAHNTVVVDGQDQNTSPEVVAGLTATGTNWAYQSGSHGLYPGVVHRRSVLVLERDLTLVYDTLESATQHDYAQVWHLASGDSLSVAALDSTGLAPDGQPTVMIRQGLGEGLSLVPLIGATEPMQGWLSESYGTRVPNHALEYHASASNWRYVTLIATGPKAQVAANIVATVSEDGTLTALVCGGASPALVTISKQAAVGEAVTVTEAAASCPPATGR